MHIGGPAQGRRIDAETAMEARRVASLFAAREDAAIARFLLDAGWQSEVHDSAFDKCHVGLAYLTSSDPDWLAKIRHTVVTHRRIPWIAMVDPGLIERDAVREFIAIHCIDYQTLPLDGQRLLAALGHAVGMARLIRPEPTMWNGTDCTSMLIGHSHAMKSLRRDLVKIASVDACALITGETGTGKELAARAIHQLSSRRDRPFVAINCVSLPPSLIHAELFGFEKGAFTGAHQRKVGHIEAARGGTIFLDEVGDLHADLQALLLRFLEEQTVRRVGGRDEIHVDARVLAATNVDLESAVKHGKFREDLYYRLNVLRAKTPPLREHSDDIEALALTFLDRYVDDNHTRLRGYTKAALRALRAHSWPGNVRELLNRIRRAIVMCDGTMITPHDLGLDVETPDQPTLSLDAARFEAEKNTLLAALRKTGWNARKSADLVGVSRATFYRLLERHGLAAEPSGTIEIHAPFEVEVDAAPTSDSVH
jgi:DNA-binding NtrC family response regulator